MSARPGADKKSTDTSLSSLRLNEWLYLAFVLTLPIVWPFSFRFSGLTVQIGDLLFAGAATAWLVDLARGKVRFRRSWLYLPLALYLTALICSTLGSINPTQSGIKLVGKVYLISITILTFHLVLPLSFLRRIAATWEIGTGLTITCCILGIVLFYAGLRHPSINPLLSGYGTLPPGNYPRIRGPFEYAALLCNYLSISFVIALIMRSAGWLKERLFWFLTIGIWFAGISTLTPGLGGLVLSTGLWFGLELKKWKCYSWSKLAFAAGITAALAFLIATSVTLFSYSPHGAEVPLAQKEIKPSIRVIIWQATIETFKQHPFFGRGLGIGVAAVSYIDPSGRRVLLTDAHNMYLSVAAESGIVGFVALASIIIFLVRDFGPMGMNHSLTVVIKTCLLLGLIDAFFYQSLVGSFEDARHIWVLFGLMAAAKQGWHPPVPGHA